MGWDGTNTKHCNMDNLKELTEKLAKRRTVLCASDYKQNKLPIMTRRGRGRWKGCLNKVFQEI